MLAVLKIKILEAFGSQTLGARRLGIDEVRLSRIIRQHIEPRADERKKLIAAFGGSALRRGDKTVRRMVGKIAS